MKKNLCVLACAAFMSVTTITYADSEKKIIACPANETMLSKQFENHWQLTTRNYYISKARANIHHTKFTGALHTISPVIPEDANPHLRFSYVQIDRVKEEGRQQINCKYFIGNPDMHDLGDGYLHMTTRVDFSDKCKLVDKGTVVCRKD